MEPSPATKNLAKYKTTVKNSGGYANGIAVQGAIMTELRSHPYIVPLNATVGAGTASVVYRASVPRVDAEKEVVEVMEKHLAGALTSIVTVVEAFASEVVVQTAVDTGDAIKETAQGVGEIATGSSLKWLAIAVIAVVSLQYLKVFK